MDYLGLMRVGLTELRLKPAEFWALTPFELMTMSGRIPASRPMVRARLEELGRAFPDMQEKSDD
ncbi:phage tail assembly chaperone [Donghicola sp. C2-DW-16]|uniref:Phage tail assembly chaperone n=1 Tax=Donghicola mangrovi TaxID=2729614 RepID=A0ABX2PFI0_9RHOB|nr:phage tail assembly chaperone [Donghicola mangrovi]